MESIRGIWEKGIIAMIPTYGKNGENQTQIITTKNENIFIDKSIRSFLSQLLREKGVDLCLLRQRNGQILQRRNGIPIAIGERMILIPVKVRIPIGRADGSQGYVSMEHVEKVQGTEKKVSIYLAGGREITSLLSKRTVEGRMVFGKLIQHSYKEEKRYWEQNHHRSIPQCGSGGDCDLSCTGHMHYRFYSHYGENINEEEF